MTKAIKVLLATTALFFSAQTLASGGCGFETENTGLIGSCTQEEQEVILTGMIEPKTLIQEDDFSEGYQSYQVDQGSLAALKSVTTPTEIVVIIGTWCPDCHRETPRFISIMEELNNPNITAKYIGVDRQKKDDEGLANEYEFTRIPTFIVIQDGKEIGRIVERPTESLEKDLAKILK
ncbi:thioredoxin family protein [Shewanella corallii]|uniref:Thioredoxin family protein n=1 Tax=Shewanella corallii TaxID=560080 RepID=A0ABT0N182_9GAMM|nr:thioredoxin family protein [Shewanella corallii]MCL2912201.1 thioredoxin family protein [Shewanella corallii]